MTTPRTPESPANHPGDLNAYQTTATNVTLDGADRAPHLSHMPFAREDLLHVPQGTLRAPPSSRYLWPAVAPTDFVPRGRRPRPRPTERSKDGQEDVESTTTPTPASPSNSPAPRRWRARYVRMLKPT